LNALKTKRQTFLTDLSELDRVLSLYDEISDPSIPHKVWLQGQLALAEGFTNAVRHAHQGMSVNTPIEVELMLFSRRFEMRIWDYGPPFDLKAAIHQYGHIRGHLSPGTRGLLILDRISDDLSYTRVKNKSNCLLIVKYY
jgi:serine/threonine-protein kinase RsbW